MNRLGRLLLIRPQIITPITRLGGLPILHKHTLHRSFFSTQLPTPPSLPDKKVSIWQKVKNEAVHYWQGTKLLGTEVAISSRLLVKLLKGLKLSRREYRQLKRTTADLLRLVPFLIIVLIPFLELALPLILKLFPNMLPSTFTNKFQEEEKRRKLLKMRLEMASFLQETIAESSSAASSTRSQDAHEFSDFFMKCRSSGEAVPTDDILKIAKKFPNELTMNNLSRPQLVSMAKYMNLNAFGTDAFLRHQITRRLEYLQSDDRLISAEGVDNLTISELIQVCQSRGIRTIGVSPARMRREVNQWIELSLRQEIPPSLLILSRAFQLSDRVPESDQDALKDSASALQATLSSLPHQMVHEAQLKISEAEGVATYKQKLDVLKEQEELIADELEEEANQEASKKLKKGEEEALKKAQETSSQPSTSFTESGDIPITASVPGKVVEEDEEGRLSGEELQKLGEALKSMTKESALEDVKEKLADLKEDREEFRKQKQESPAAQPTSVTPEKTPAIENRVDKMIKKIEDQLSAYDVEIGSKLNLIRPDDQGQITSADLENALKVIQNHPNDERIKKIIQKLDADGDGLVALKQVLKLAEDADNEGQGKVETVLGKK